MYVSLFFVKCVRNIFRFVKYAASFIDDEDRNSVHVKCCYFCLTLTKAGMCAYI
jgi:hypothetical protein